MTYEIHLHPAYRLPCLWFSLHGLPDGEPAFDIDTVFRRLVPDAYKSGLRQGIGAIGGISADVSNAAPVATVFPLDMGLCKYTDKSYSTTPSLEFLLSSFILAFSATPYLIFLALVRIISLFGLD